MAFLLISSKDNGDLDAEKIRRDCIELINKIRADTEKLREIRKDLEAIGKRVTKPKPKDD